MNKELVTRILIQLEPSLAQEFGLAIAKDEKKLKALKIINKKCVSIIGIRVCDTFDEYNEFYKNRGTLTQEEFDLLKEML